MKNNIVIDISREIHPEMIGWPGDTPFEHIEELRMSEGAVCNLSSIRASLHTGTHIDAPKHIIEGTGDILSLPLTACTGAVKVFELRVPQCIMSEDLSSLDIETGDAVFFKTSNSLLPCDRFYEDFVYLHPSAAELLCEIGIRTVGIDYLSIDSYCSDLMSHRLILSKGIVIIEGLCLKDVEPGEYQFSCLPLKIKSADGSPARAVLFR